MNILIVGPGAIGCLFGAALANAGNRVLLLGRNADHAAAVSASGIHVQHESRDWFARAQVTVQLPEQYHADVVLICVKAFDTVIAARQVAPVVDEATLVASLQNGLRNPEQIAAQLSTDRVVCVSTTQGATMLAPGQIRHAGGGLTLAGAYVNGHESDARQIADLFTAAGIPTEPATHTLGMLWSKLIVNAGLNPVTALADVPNGALLERTDLLDMAQRAAQEAQRVAAAKGVPLLFQDAASELRHVCAQTRGNISSMLQDRRRGRRTEIDAINGVVVEEGRALDIDTPANRMLIRRMTA